MKLYKKSRKGKELPKLYSYLQDLDSQLKTKCQASSADYFCNIKGVDEALRVCSAIQIEQTMKTIINSEEDPKKLMNEVMANEVVRMSTMHIQYVSFKVFVDKIHQMPDLQLQKHFENMACLAGLHLLSQHLAVGFDGGYFKSGDRVLVSDAYNKLLATIRP